MRKRGSRESTPPKIQEEMDQNNEVPSAKIQQTMDQTADQLMSMKLTDNEEDSYTMHHHIGHNNTSICIDMTLPDLSATQLQQYNRVIESMEREHNELQSTNEGTRYPPLEAGDSVHESRYFGDEQSLIDRNHVPYIPEEDLHPSDAVDQSLQQELTGNAASQSVSTSITNSQDSTLNGTIVAAEDKEESKTEESNSAVQSIAIEDPTPGQRQGFFPSVHSPPPAAGQDAVTLENAAMISKQPLSTELPRSRTEDDIESAVQSRSTSAKTAQDNVGAKLSTQSKVYFPSIQQNAITDQDVSSPTGSKSVPRTEGQIYQPAQISTIESPKTSSMEAASSRAGFFPPLQSTAMSSQEFLYAQRMGQLGNVKLFDGALRDSWGDSESNMSLLGEYHMLPTPIPIIDSSSTNISTMPNPSTDTSNGPPIGVFVSSLDNSNAPKEESVLNRDETNEDDNRAKTDGDLTTEDLSSVMVSYSNMPSTRSLTLDTLAQSCTLPLSLFSSMGSNSTLCEVQDPFSSNSNLPLEVAVEDLRNDGLVRSAPVGQEASDAKPKEVINDTNTASSKTTEAKEYNSQAYTTPQDEFKSSRNRVRRNSYTLEHPSPALLDAQARNEAPYASDEGSPALASGDDEKPSARRSLELDGRNSDSGRSESGRTEKQFTKEGQHDVHPPSGTGKGRLYKCTLIRE